MVIMVKELFSKCKENAKEGRGTYLSGTKRLATLLKKEVMKYQEDSKLDYELGVITKEEHQKEINMVELMLKSINCMQIS